MKTSLTRPGRLTAVLCASVLALSACASSDDGKEDKGATTGGGASLSTSGLVNIKEAGEPVQGGKLRVVELSEARSLNPAVTYGNGSTGMNVMASIYDTLMRYDVESEAYVPQLAESLESDDNLTWVLTLRDGVKFTDGTPLNADAVVSSLEYYIANYGYKGDIIKSNLKSMKATADNTVTFTFNSPWATFPTMMAAGPGLVMAPAAYKDPKNFAPIGAGPFKLKSQAPAEKTIVEANDDYFDGRPYLDTIDFVVLATDKTQYESLASGDSDLIYIREDDIAKKAFDSGMPGAVSAVSGWRTLTLNTAKGSATSDVRVRQAISLAMDAAIWMDRFNGDTDRADRELMDPVSSVWDTDVEPVEADPAAAKKLLDEAKADGYDGKLRYVAPSDAQSQSGAVATKALLEKAGFDVILDLTSSITDQVQKVYVDGDFDMASGATSILDSDAYAGLYSPLSSASTSNAGRYANPEMDKLLSDLAATATPEEGSDTMTAIEELWKKDVPYVNISGGSYYNVWGKNVHGMLPTTETAVLFNKAWIAKK